MNKLLPYFLKTTSFVWYSLILLLLAAGWSAREQNYLVAESGIGYWFGIIGGSMLLLIYLYPLRKRFQRWSAIGSVKSWFRLHMILGVAGPVIIVLHSGFELGSFNSSVAFFCMLLVTLSGLFGRKLYERIHHGLYGRKVRFEEYYSNDDLPGLLLRGSGAIDFDILEKYEDIEQKLIHRHTGVNRSLRFYLTMKSRVGRMRKQVAKSDFGVEEKGQIDTRLKDLHSICILGINEILFSYWHVFHIPLLVMLLLSGLIHVVVVHLY
ncbi:MAG: hypothetical protein HKN34_04590 [Gammaproteobacteria bacterium]|nr:hypothetical protein [Gammaproteobacteria bacterium]